MYPKYRNRINRIRKRQNKMFNLMSKKISTLDFQDKDDFKFYLNILNQLHFLNKTYDELEENAKIYLKFIEDYLGVKISIVSIGPKRSETIIV